jgi:predicted transposase YbfD/YdcC
MAPLSLLEVMADVPDPRSRHGRRHPLVALLALTVLAMLRGCKGPTAIAQFGRDHGIGLAHALGFRRGKTPAPSCLSDFYRVLDADAFEAALSRWIASRLPAPAENASARPISLDGKTLRGSRDGEAPGHHLVSAYAHEHQAVLAQIRVDAKTNEHKAALELLGILPLRGHVVLGDAMFCQRDLCAKIIKQGGDYLFMVKGNQQGLERDIAAGFGFEAGARQMAAAFSPRTAATAAGACQHGKRAWPAGEEDGADDRDLDAAAKVAWLGPGPGDHAGADGTGQDDGGGGICHDQPEAGAGRRAAAVGIGA